MRVLSIKIPLLGMGRSNNPAARSRKRRSLVHCLRRGTRTNHFLEIRAAAIQKSLHQREVDPKSETRRKVRRTKIVAHRRRISGRKESAMRIFRLRNTLRSCEILSKLTSDLLQLSEVTMFLNEHEYTRNRVIGSKRANRRVDPDRGVT